MMRIGVFKHGWWETAGKALSHEAIPLPIAESPTGNAYAADLAARIAHGSAITTDPNAQGLDLLIDSGGTGLGFARDPDNPDSIKLLHEVLGKPLLSHFIDPLSTAFQGLEWQTVWQCLSSTSWVKAIWDRTQVIELQKFGVPNVIHLPMAAINRPYDTQPLDPSTSWPIVSFVGGQNTTYFSANSPTPTGNLLPGVLAHAARADIPNTSFFEAYHTLYGLGELPSESDDLVARANKVIAYFNAKLFFNAALCLRNRDRYVIFLKRRLGDRFHLVGRGWDTAYGLPTAPQFETNAAYLNHFRQAAINLNLVNGNAETGLNMRHFEITAAGGFMLCHDQPELRELFDVGKECVAFRGEQDLVDKIEFYLAHPEERCAIALAGQRRTLSDHLYSHRLATLLDAIHEKPLPVEYATTDLWSDLRSFVPKPRVILDCGANVGQMVRGFRKAYPDSEIYSFEPVSTVYEQLCAVCEEAKAHPVKLAVSDREGTATMHLTASPEANSLLGFQEGNPCAQWTKEVGEESVEVGTLDGWCERSGVNPDHIDILKLDVQGAELEALYGARKLLGTVRAVYLEVSFVPIYKDCPLFDEVDSFMTECGYRRFAIYPSDQPHNWGDALYVKTPGKDES